MMSWRRLSSSAEMPFSFYRDLIKLRYAFDSGKAAEVAGSEHLPGLLFLLALLALLVLADFLVALLFLLVQDHLSLGLESFLALVHVFLDALDVLVLLGLQVFQLLLELVPLFHHLVHAQGLQGSLLLQGGEQVLPHSLGYLLEVLLLLALLDWLLLGLLLHLLQTLLHHLVILFPLLSRLSLHCSLSVLHFLHLFLLVRDHADLHGLLDLQLFFLIHDLLLLLQLDGDHDRMFHLSLVLLELEPLNLFVVALLLIVLLGTLLLLEQFGRLQFKLLVPLEHESFDGHEVIDDDDLLEEFGVPFVLESLLHHGQELVPADSDLVQETFQLAVYESLEPVVHVGVGELVLLGVFELGAVLVDELLDRRFPDGTGQILQHVLVDPLVLLFHRRVCLGHLLHLLFLLLLEPTEHDISPLNLSLSIWMQARGNRYKYNLSTMFDSKLNMNKRQTHISTVTNIGKDQKKNNHQFTDRRYRVPNSELSSLWGEYRVQGKMIESRSGHISCIYKDRFYVHGGKSNQVNAFCDVQGLKLKGNEHELQEWELIEAEGARLKRHTGVVREEQWVIYGGIDEKDRTSNDLHVFCLDYHEWSLLPQNNRIDALDSHCAALTEENNMLVFGGFCKDKGAYSNSLHLFDFATASWTALFDPASAPKTDLRPSGRCHSSLCVLENKVYVFGGMNGNHKMKDFWCFDLGTKKWSEITSRDPPCERSGHAVLVFKDKMYLFGGIQDLTKEKNDLYYYDFTNTKWVEVYENDETPDSEERVVKKEERGKSEDPEEEVKETVQRKKKTYKPLAELNMKPTAKYLKSSHRETQEMKQTHMKATQPVNAIAEQKSKVRSQNKQNLLNQFKVKDSQGKEELRLQTPLTEAMRNSIEVIQHKNLDSRGKKKEDKMQDQVTYDFMDIVDYSKAPCPRDGHTLTLFKKKMVIFGGDRHKMNFNDVFLIQLDRVQEQLYK